MIHAPRLYLWLPAWLLLMAGCLVLLRDTPVTHDITQFLPTGATQEQKLAASLLRTGPASRLILVGLENASPAELAETSRRMATLLQESDLFSLVTNGTGVGLDELQLEYQYRYLLDPDSDAGAFSTNSLQKALQQRLREISGALPMLDPTQLAHDPTAVFRSVLGNWKPARQPSLKYGVWFSTESSRALLLTMTRAAGFVPDSQAQAIAAIHTAFTEAKTTAGTRLLLSGSPVFAHNARNTIRSSLTTLSSVAGILVSLFILYMYRSVYLLLLASVPIITGLLAGSLVTSWVFGYIHGITLVFGITLFGVAIDYPIHLFSNLDPTVTARQSMTRIWPTLRLGVITTCIGYLAFARPDFTGLAQLGLFTGCGLLTAAAVTRWLLPALLTNGRRHGHDTALPRALYSLVSLTPRMARVFIVAAVTGLALLLWQSPPVWESDLSAMSPLSRAELKLDDSLRHAIGAPDASQLVVLGAADSESLLQQCEHVAGILQQAVDLDLLEGFDAPTRYLPSAATQGQRRDRLPDPVVLGQRLDAAMQGLPFRQDAFDPFVAAVSASRGLPPLTVDDIEGTSTGLRLQSLLFSDASGWKALIPLSGITPGTGFRDWWMQQDVSDALLLDLKETSTAMLNGFRDSSLERLLLGIAAILLVVSVGLASISQALRTLLPVLLSVALTTALLGGIGERLSLFHLISLLLITGIGIDYSLFFHHATRQATLRPGIIHALIICAVSTITVFGMLSLSPIPVLHSIGITVTIGIPLCFLLDLAFSRLTTSGQLETRTAIDH